MSRTKAIVLGASGYIGGEAVRLLLGHPKIDLVAVGAHDSAGLALTDLQPNLRGLTSLVFRKNDELLDAADVYFLSLPHGEAQKTVPRLPKTARIIDLSGDFRLADRAAWETHYKMPHAAWELQRDFVYGLPEINRARLRDARRVAAAGCFATASILSAWPATREGLVSGTIIIDGKTGSSGSGSKPGDKTHHPFRAGAFYAYEMFHHRHTPEIRQALGGVEVLFQPHSAPMVRGVFTTAYLPLSREVAEDEMIEVYRRAYAESPCVRIAKGTPNVAYVRGSNFADVGVNVRGRTAVVFAAIDNLLKGGASQGVQCMNLMCGFDENEGLNQVPSMV